MLSYLVAALISFYTALKLILVYVYGFAVLWEGVPESLDRGPGDGFFMLFVPPLALIFWLVCVAMIRFVASRWGDN